MVSTVGIMLALLPAAAAVSLADPKDASAEVAKRCMSGDLSGATALLESRGQPIGWQHGKYMLMTCFTDETGKCLLTNSQCAWLQRCLEEEGPCESPSIESLLELPGGELALATLKEDANSSVVVQGQRRYKMSKIMEVAKAMANGWESPEEQKGAAFLQRSRGPIKYTSEVNVYVNGEKKALSEYVQDEHEAFMASTTFPPLLLAIKDKVKAFLKDGYEAVHKLKFDTLATERKRRYFYGMGTLPLFYLATCGMEDEGAMMDVFGQPKLGFFTPGGPGKTPTGYVDVIRKYKPRGMELFAEGGEFIC